MRFPTEPDTSDQVFVIRQTIEKCEHDVDVRMLFVDFRQAFESVRRVKLYDPIRDMSCLLYTSRCV